MPRRLPQAMSAHKSYGKFARYPWFALLCRAAHEDCGRERALDGLPPDALLRQRLVVDFQYWLRVRHPAVARRISTLFAAYAAALEHWNEHEGCISTSP